VEVGFTSMFEIGTSLREARVRRGLELEEVEERTAIRSRYLAAIEEERFVVLPKGVYRRSFIREYADFLGLDGDLYVEEYMSRHEPEEAEQTLAPPALRRRDRISPPTLVKLSATLVGAALVGLAVWGLGGTESKPESLEGRAGTEARAPTFTPPVRPRPAVRPTPPRATSIALTASRGRCWISVRLRSRDGPVVLERTLEEGETVRLGLKAPLWIRLGAPQNLDARMRGKLVELPRQLGDVLVTGTGVRQP
jgi:transcriptional regulator with XRE-family HTH domain